ncbi:MAG TPA: MarC family protein [Candidatus Limnocylindria bacterium]|nr:MarC family protein [Candidatus Limnocylindria bacterium]
MSPTEYALLALSSLFVIIDPVATVPAFLAMTAPNTPAERIKMARLACSVCAALLLAFAVAGRWIFHFLGITIPAFQMAGSVVLLLIALDMLNAKRSRVHETQEETDAGTVKEDIAVTPLAVPMLAGPGAISTVVLLQAKADSLLLHGVLFGCILIVCFASYAILAIGARTTKWISPIAMRVTTRIMGLLLAAIAFQFLLNALKELKLVTFPEA